MDGASLHVSVVLPCFNASDTLRAAVDSIRHQTLIEWECIIADDGSTDDSPDIAAQIATRDHRVRLLRLPHAGIVHALQAGCAEVRAPFIARMDADDIALPQRLEKQVRFMQAHPDTALCGTHVQMFGKTVKAGRRRYERWLNSLETHDDIVRELFIECPIAHPAFFMRRQTFERVGGYEDHGWAEDYDLCMRFFLEGARFGMVPEPLLQWRESPDRLSMRAKRYDPTRFRKLKRAYLLRSYLANRPRFHQWGAGEVGKLWLREWKGLQPEAVIDINPRKIGRAIHGVPVIAPDDLPGPDETFIVIAVGAPGARDEIRAWLAPRGYAELHDFLFVA